MSDIETNVSEEQHVDGDEILDVTIIEDVEEPVVESAFDRAGRWYIVHTFAGHEQKVIGALNNIIKSRELSDSIYEIYLPEEDVTEFKSGKKVTVSKRMFPSYLLIRCEPDPEIFYVIGSTPGVTGFVGAEKTRPTALTRREVECLRWVLKGKSDTDIGKILGISHTTAHFHIERVKKKLGVKTRTQAAAVVVSLGYL